VQSNIDRAMQEPLASWYLRAYRMHTMGLHRACMRGRVCVLRGNSAAASPAARLQPSSSFPSRQATKESIDCVTEAQARTNNAAMVPPRPLGRTIEARSAARPTSDPDRDPPPRSREQQGERERERERETCSALTFLLGFHLRGSSRFRALPARPFRPPPLSSASRCIDPFLVIAAYLCINKR